LACTREKTLADNGFGDVNGSCERHSMSEVGRRLTLARVNSSGPVLNVSKHRVLRLRSASPYFAQDDIAFEVGGRGRPPLHRLDSNLKLVPCEER
jgi:hypothetical protein